MNPIIGVISYPYYDKDGTEIFQVSKKVIDFINKLGGIPISILPPNLDDFYRKDKINLNTLSKEELIKLRELLRICDGIIKPGSYYFFTFQEEAYKYILDYSVPYLGICNGLQLMSRVTNSNLKMELNESDVEHKDSYHEVEIIRGSKLHKIIGKDNIIVRSFHNYHIPYTTRFNVNARSKDGYIEGIESDSFNIGVQWHPEYDLNDENSIRLFESFINASKVYKKVKN